MKIKSIILDQLSVDIYKTKSEQVILNLPDWKT